MKEGDEVLIVRKVADHSEDWKNSWIVDMDKFVGDGVVYRVMSIVGKAGVVLCRASDGAQIRFRWPPTALVLATPDLFDVEET